jgi:dihydrofolate reductase
VRNVIYSMTMSADGFINGPDGTFEWGAPDEELHRFHNERVRELGAHFLGRRLYETMVYWETAEDDPAAGPVVVDFARIWKALQKIVFSNTLESVEGNTRLATGGIAEEVAALKAQPGKDLAVGGAGLAAAFAALDLIDEYQVFVCPVIVGGGTRLFPAVAEQVDLELVETRTFGSRVVYLRYRRQ